MFFQGCEVVISGKLRGQRAKAMKFTDGLMIHTGHPVTEYVDVAVRHVLLRQGVIGLKVGFAIIENFSCRIIYRHLFPEIASKPQIQVKIMLPHDPTGKVGPKTPYPDIVEIREPKEEEPYVPQAVAAAPATPAPAAEEAA